MLNRLVIKASTQNTTTVTSIFLIEIKSSSEEEFRRDSGQNPSELDLIFF